MFQNPEIALDELPGTEEADWQKLHPQFVRRMQIQALIMLGISTVAIIIAKIVLGIPLLPILLLYALLVIIAIASLAWPALSIRHRGYVLRDKDILFRKGVLWRSVTAVPFNRIQHVETSNTPLDRKLGLATLQLFTAGGSGADLKIEGLGKDVAERLRLFILDKAGASIENH